MMKSWAANRAALISPPEQRKTSRGTVSCDDPSEREERAEPELSKEASEGLQGVFMGVSGGLHGGFREDSCRLHGSFMRAPDVFTEELTGSTFNKPASKTSHVYSTHHSSVCGAI